MTDKPFRAYYVEESENGISASVREVPGSFLPDHEVTIEVHYSSLNYKDGLSATGNKGVTRSYPHIPGIDAAGIVLNDTTGTWKQGDRVVVTGRDLGSNTPGGFGERIRVPEEWVVPLPEGLSLKDAMIYGTAGFTAMYGIERLIREKMKPGKSEILVTGATGGVGSLAVYFLAGMGFHVIAATGKTEKADFLKEIGAAEVIHRDEVSGAGKGLLLSRKWDGAIETVGGEMLDAVIRQSGHDGAVACCGNILGHEVHTNIYPFILRGVSLLGIDSAICKNPLRKEIWKKMEEIRPAALPAGYVSDCTKEGLEAEIHKILDGGQAGRVVLSHKMDG